MSTMAKIWLGVSGVLLLGLLLMLNLYGGLKDNYQLLSEKHARLSVINDITQAAIAVNHRVSLDNINAKQVEGTEHVKIKTIIKTEFKDSECAVAPVSSGVIGKLQQYERDIRARTGGSDFGSSSR